MDKQRSDEVAPTTNIKSKEKGRNAVVLMDGAGWHTEDLNDELRNVSIKLPPYSPELPLIEQAWKAPKDYQQCTIEN